MKWKIWLLITTLALAPIVQAGPGGHGPGGSGHPGRDGFKR